MITGRRGFTLVELMVALVLVVAVCGVTYALLAQNQRVSRSQVEHAGLQDAVRAGALVIASELKEIGYDSIPDEAGLGTAATVSPDLLVMMPGRLEYKAMRGIGFTCAAPSLGQLRLRRATLIGLRQPEVGDSITAHVEGDSTTGADDAWVHAGITGVSTALCRRRGSGGCAYSWLRGSCRGCGAGADGCRRSRPVLRGDGAALLPVYREVLARLAVDHRRRSHRAHARPAGRQHRAPSAV